MRTTALALVFAAACAGRRPVADPLDSAWASLARSELAEVSVERRLYQHPGNPHFLIRVRVTNRTNTDLSVDLVEAWKVFYPNQWGGLPEPRRTAIDEEYMEPAELTPAVAERVKTGHPSDALTRIPARGSVDYYREFNASGRKDVDATDAPYLFISIQGQLLVTDGDLVESILPADSLYLFISIQGQLLVTDGDLVESILPADSLYLRKPVLWSEVPAGGRIVAEG